MCRHSPIYLRIVLATILMLPCGSLFAEEKNATEKAVARDPAEISREQTALVRLTSKKVDETERVKAIVDLCKLFVEVGEHPEIDKNPTLQRVSTELQTRLRGIEDRLVSELRQRNIPEPESMIEAARSKRKSQARNSASSPTSSNSDSSSIDSSNSDNSANIESLDSTSSRAGLGGRGLGGPGSIDEMGWWLVDLIRHTVQPSYWDTAGGPGTIVYYGPSRALVVRGSWRIHEAVADMLSALR